MTRLKQLRLERGWSQLDLALRTGLHPSVISRLERGVWPPYRGWRARIAEAFGMPVEQADELFQDVAEGS
jgi:transcriptional regulator with XRE-family HTH domain